MGYKRRDGARPYRRCSYAPQCPYCGRRTPRGVHKICEKLCTGHDQSEWNGILWEYHRRKIDSDLSDERRWVDSIDFTNVGELGE